MSRATPALIAIGLTLGAFGAAYGVNAVIASLLAVPEGSQPVIPSVGPTSTQSAPVATAARAQGRRQYLETLKCHNLFDPAANASCRVEPDGPGGQTGPVLTDLNVKLLGTMVAEPVTLSSALIATEGTGGTTRGYGLGDKIADAEVVGIRVKEVTLRRGNGDEEVLRMDDEKVPARAEVSGEASDGTGVEGIEQLGENKFAISRDTFDKYIGDMEGLAQMGRALLHRGPDGDFDGYRLSSIRRNTVAEQIGIKNGDVVHSVNGKGLNSMQSAMEAYSQLQSEGTFSVDVTRRGQKVTLEYEIR